MRFTARKGPENFQPGDTVTSAKRREPGFDLIQRWWQ
jgi:hypothetical protein